VSYRNALRAEGAFFPRFSPYSRQRKERGRHRGSEVARGSDERGDRTVGERQNGGQAGQKGGTRNEGRKGRDRDRTDKRGGMCSVKKEAKELRHRPTRPEQPTAHVQWATGGRVIVYVVANRRHHSKRKKRKALTTHY
jgi:hypothetical protein